MQSALYTGSLFHCRHLPRKHAFQYRVFMPFVDIEALTQITRGVPFWSSTRPAPARFNRADFLGDSAEPLINAVRQRIFEETGKQHTGKVFLLANWRYFGYQNNPIACYFCYDPTGQLQYVVAEVTNTPWGERHSYVLPASDNGTLMDLRFEKAMHVSPFNPMNMTYHWRSIMTGDRLAIRLSNYSGKRRIFDATLSLRAEPMSRKNLSAVLLRYPFMTAKVVAGIYWQALRLWLKRTPLHSHPNSR